MADPLRWHLDAEVRRWRSNPAEPLRARIMDLLKTLGPDAHPRLELTPTRRR